MGKKLKILNPLAPLLKQSIQRKIGAMSLVGAAQDMCRVTGLPLTTCQTVVLRKVVGSPVLVKAVLQWTGATLSLDLSTVDPLSPPERPPRPLPGTQPWVY